MLPKSQLIYDIKLQLIYLLQWLPIIFEVLTYLWQCIINSNWSLNLMMAMNHSSNWCLNLSMTVSYNCNWHLNLSMAVNPNHNLHFNLSMTVDHNWNWSFKLLMTVNHNCNWSFNLSMRVTKITVRCNWSLNWSMTVNHNSKPGLSIGVLNHNFDKKKYILGSANITILT